MTSRRGAQMVGLVVLVLLLLASAYYGLVEGLDATRSAGTAGMRVATVTQLLYGVTAVLALVFLLVKRSWVFAVLLLWALTVTATAALAPVVYGGSPVRVGALSGAVTAMLVGMVLWPWRRASAAPTAGPPVRPSA